MPKVGRAHQSRCQCQVPLAIVVLFQDHSRNPRPFPPRHNIGNGRTTCQRLTDCRRDHGAQPGWLLLCSTCAIACRNVVDEGWRPPAGIAQLTPQLLLHCHQRLTMHLLLGPIIRTNASQGRADRRANNPVAHRANMQRQGQRRLQQRLEFNNILALPTGNGPNQFNARITLHQQIVPACNILDTLGSVWSDGYMAWAKNFHLIGHLMTDAHVMYSRDMIQVSRHEASQVHLAVHVPKGLSELDSPYREALGGRGNTVPVMTVGLHAHCPRRDQAIGHVITQAPVLVAGGLNQALLDSGLALGNAVKTYNDNVQAHYSGTHDQLRALRRYNRQSYDNILVDPHICLGYLLSDFNNPLLVGVRDSLETILLAAISGALPAADSNNAVILEALQRGTLRARVFGATGCHVLSFYAACRFPSSHSGPRGLRLDVTQGILWRGEHCFNIHPLVAKAKMIILAVASDGMMKQNYMELAFSEDPNLCDFLEGCFLECFGIQMNFVIRGGSLINGWNDFGAILYKLYVGRREALRRFYKATVELEMDGWLPFAKRQNCLVVAAEYNQDTNLIPCLAALAQAET